MWFIKVDKDLTISKLCGAAGLVTSVAQDAFSYTLSLVLKPYNDDNLVIYTNIMVPIECIRMNRNGAPIFDIDPEMNGLNLYLPDDRYVVAKEFLDYLYQKHIRATMVYLPERYS